MPSHAAVISATRRGRLSWNRLRSIDRSPWKNRNVAYIASRCDVIVESVWSMGPVKTCPTSARVGVTTEVPRPPSQPPSLSRLRTICISPIRLQANLQAPNRTTTMSLEEYLDRCLESEAESTNDDANDTIPWHCPISSNRLRNGMPGWLGWKYSRMSSSSDVYHRYLDQYTKDTSRFMMIDDR